MPSGDPLGFRCFAQPVVDGERFSDLQPEIALEVISRSSKPGKVEDGALHEGSTGLPSGMLVQETMFAPAWARMS